MAISGHAATSLGNGGGRSRRWATELGGGGGPHGAAGGLRPQPEKPRARPWGGVSDAWDVLFMPSTLPATCPDTATLQGGKLRNEGRRPDGQTEPHPSRTAIRRLPPQRLLPRLSAAPPPSTDPGDTAPIAQMRDTPSPAPSHAATAWRGPRGPSPSCHQCLWLCLEGAAPGTSTQLCSSGCSDAASRSLLGPGHRSSQHSAT